MEDAHDGAGRGEGGVWCRWRGRTSLTRASVDSDSHSQALGSTPRHATASKEGTSDPVAQATPHPTPAPSILKIRRGGGRKEINFPSSLTDFDLGSFKG